jgi:hypothetical protein
MLLPWNVYAMTYDKSLKVAERLDLNGGTQFEPSPLASILFEDRNEAFAFVLTHRGAYELSRYKGDDFTLVSTPVENLPIVEDWLEKSCAKPWLATAWVRVSFCSDVEKQGFEQALYAPKPARTYSPNPVVEPQDAAGTSQPREP